MDRRANPRRGTDSAVVIGCLIAAAVVSASCRATTARAAAADQDKELRSKQQNEIVNPQTTNQIPGAPAGLKFVDPDLPSGQWTKPSGDYGALRYSTLNQITTTNVQNLHVVTTLQTGIPHGHEG